jgi:hypothetical protein
MHVDSVLSAVIKLPCMLNDIHLMPVNFDICFAKLYHNSSFNHSAIHFYFVDSKKYLLHFMESYVLLSYQ